MSREQRRRLDRHGRPHMNAAAAHPSQKAIARAVVRELTAFAQPIVDVRPPKNVYDVGPFIIDLDRHEITADDEQIDLKPREFKLFTAFARNADPIPASHQKPCAIGFLRGAVVTYARVGRLLQSAFFTM